MRVLYKRLSLTRLRTLSSYCCRWGSSRSADPHVAIVGSGPAGFYTAQQIIKGHPTVRVDIYEKLPVPFGLVRFGVAPDHPEVKNCIHTFTQTAHRDRCSFIGNVQVGKDIKVADLQKAYTAVVLCHGSSNDRKLGIPGEDLPNVLSARSFVGWYNGLPEDVGLSVNLDCETAIVLGHGNVALDVARVLLTPIDILAKTDISDYSMDALSKSRIKKVVLVGRRGPLQVAFTIKELREMITLPKCRTVIDLLTLSSLNENIDELPRPRRRLTELLYNAAVNPPEKYTKIWNDATREWHLKFLRSPSEIVPTSSKEGPEAVKFIINMLEGDDDPLRRKAVPTDETDVIPCGLVLRSIGYKGVPLDETVPFDTSRGVIPNKKGRVDGFPGLYCSGWIAEGPVFVLAGAMNNAFATGKVVLEDLGSSKLSSENKGGKDAVLSALQQKGVKTVTFTDWEKIDQAEILLGEKAGKPREKIVSIKEMIRVASSE
ncbi:NADPH:adrenodoxin oxidoreductase, mitochondrial-like isoform X2 [Littorina saxatilis]|uniref:NADPH:adrenodoxin oxidoreductase, mitochondrial n=1 Tax=Littorina saxatilis TaxID=31220 RepID=A0AAN9BWD8_9CAEN